MSKVGLVIAHHHDNYDFLLKWIDELKNTEHDLTIYVCLDRDDRLVDKQPIDLNIKEYSREDIKKNLGDIAWIIPNKTSAIKSYGFYKAYKDNCDYIISIDNDCFPDTPRFIDSHIRNLQATTTLGWEKTLDDEPFMRGNPYLIRDKSSVHVSHGLWSNIPDLDGPTQLQMPDYRLESNSDIKLIPQYNFYSMCGMNFGFTREVAPLMYFGLQGPDYPFDRFDDIWAGIFSKKVMDHLGLAVVSGSPWIYHSRQSDVFSNVRKESTGLEINEYFWLDIKDVDLTGFSTIKGSAKYLASKIKEYSGYEEYFIKLKEAYGIWINLF